MQRKYSLPNCTLLLEGLSDGTTGMQSTDVRPLLSILVNAECHFNNSNQPPLTGGRDFLENLAIAVSAYAQEFLSQVHHPDHQHSSRAIQFQKIGHNRHRLIVQSEQENDVDSARNPRQSMEGTNTSVNAPTVIDLTTVQLFDLVEAIDQFFADSKTLPDLSLKLTPVSKRYSGASQPLAKQAVPAALGVSSLAIAAIAFFLVPIPQPQEPKPQSSSTQSTNVNSTPAAAPEITDSVQVNALQQQLYNQLNQAWKTRSNVDQDLIYRVVVADNGKLVGYKSVSATANDYIKQTPLPDLLSNPAANRVGTQQAIAQFKVVFTGKGVLQVSPWNTTN
ncbi:MAG: DUF4335 domain-containing protein [Gloeocapsa sp. UFS-A4-WI-NPMV-4B04]|nr:DUF4335 domain-containing protein [Gloeocapsa sp. UFS-A4-WI-NPMV-4B04]